MFSFSTVTIYRLNHTYSFGSVEPTIALSKSLWSRIVTLIKKIEKEKKNCFCCLFICLFSFSTVTIYRLDNTYSLGSVEPTIALSKSLWSRIVTLIKKLKIKKNSFVSSFVSHWLWSYRVLESACLFIWAISKKKI